MRKSGKDFTVLKFATMLKASPHLPGGILMQKKDSRILSMDKFLRKTKFNELPQLANIFIGPMSFVGPRPQARCHYELYSSDSKSIVLSGLTGIGSMVFRDAEAILDEVPGDRDHFLDTIVVPCKGKLDCGGRTIEPLAITLSLSSYRLLVSESPDDVVEGVVQGFA